MTPDFVSRIIGMVILTILGARVGTDIAPQLNLNPVSSSIIIALVGFLAGLILTPWLTVRPVRAIRRFVTEMPIERLLLTLFGGFAGLLLALMLAYPLSLLIEPLNWFAPSAVSVVGGYLGMTIFGTRSREILDTLGARLGKPSGRMAGLSTRNLLLDTSVLIDGRIVDVAETGFIGGTLIIPRFVLSELHRVADSSDPLRRSRGRRGLNLLNKLQRDDMVVVRIVEDDIDTVQEVDDKLVALAIQMTASIITNDYNLNQVADAQGVPVLNLNRLANALRPMFIPGEAFAIRIIQEGRDPEQGIGYLDDGTMVVVGKRQALYG
jgi:uncharacterized protein YacL